MDPFWKQIIALIVLALPVFAIPAILKMSSGLLGRIHTLSHGFSGSKLGVNKLAEKTNFNNSHARKQFSEFRQRQKTDRQNRIAAGNYRGNNANPLNWTRNATSGLNQRLNKSGAFNTVSMGFGAERDLAMQSQNRKDRADTIAILQNDDALAIAWARTGGDASKLRDGELGLASMEQYRRMVASGFANKSDSHLAAADYLASNGKGHASDIIAAMQNAKARNASETDIESAYQSAKAAFRGSGRGDVVGELNAMEVAIDDQGRAMTKQVAQVNDDGTPKLDARGNQMFKTEYVKRTPSSKDFVLSSNLGNVRGMGGKQITLEEQIKAWGEVTPEKAHREGVKDASFQEWLDADRKNLIKAAGAFDRMEGRAQSAVDPQLLAAARLYGLSSPTTGATPTTIPELKQALGIRT